MRIYLDSNVLISLVKREFGRGFEYMDEAVQRFIDECAERGHTLVLSGPFFNEVERITSIKKDAALGYFTDVLRIEQVAPDRRDADAAEKLSRARGVHFADALHAVIAIKHKCDIIASWNLKDFDPLADLIKAATPRDFI